VKTPPQAVAQYASDNDLAARIILSDRLKYGGEGSLMVTWAHAIVDGQQRTRADWRLVA
jgi:hypothetical protein